MSCQPKSPSADTRGTRVRWAGRISRDGQILKPREEVGAIENDSVHRTLEHHHLDLVFVFEGRDNVSDLRHEFRTREIERRLSSTTRQCEGVTRSSLTCAASVAEGMTLLRLG